MYLTEFQVLRVNKLMKAGITPSINDLEMVAYLLSLMDEEVTVSYLEKVVAKYGTDIFTVGKLASNLKNGLWAYSYIKLMRQPANASLN